MRRVGQTRRRDQNEKAISQALRAVGAHVTPISGKGAPDLLVRPRGFRNGLCVGLEVKSPSGTRTQAQTESQWPIVTSVQQALEAIGVGR